MTVKFSIKNIRLPIPRIWRIEKEIINLKRKLLEEENVAFEKLLKSKMDIGNLESAIRIVVADRRLEIDLLDLERKFLMERQNNLFWRVIWNIIVPIIVTIATAWVVVHFGLK